MPDTTPTIWSRLKRWLGLDFYDQAVEEVQRESDAAARAAVMKVLLDGGSR